MVSKHLILVLCVFGTGGGCLITGIILQNSILMYVSGGINLVGILFTWYIICSNRINNNKPPQMTPVFPQYVYRNPTMKKNKSDTNLELMGAQKNTTDDGSTAIATATDAIELV